LLFSLSDFRMGCYRTHSETTVCPLDGEHTFIIFQHKTRDLLHSWSRVLLGKLVFAHLAKPPPPPHFHGTEIFVTIVISVVHTAPSIQCTSSIC
jgi:hypothetical protein